MRALRGPKYLLCIWRRQIAWAGIPAGHISVIYSGSHIMRGFGSCRLIEAEGWNAAAGTEHSLGEEAKIEKRGSAKISVLHDLIIGEERQKIKESRAFSRLKYIFWCFTKIASVVWLSVMRLARKDAIYGLLAFLQYSARRLLQAVENPGT